MKKTTIALGAMISFLNFANIHADEIDCQLGARLTDSQINLLKKAENISRVGLNKALLGTDVYRVQIMNNKLTNKLVVFLGETHIKGLRSSLIGKKLVKEFNYRLVEGVPKEEVETIKEKYPDLYSGIGWKRELFAILTFNPFGSTIGKVLSAGDTIGVTKLSKAVEYNDGDFVYNQSNLNNVIDLISKVKSKRINFPMEFGQYIEPKKDDTYILNLRNKRMAANIALVSEALSDKGDQLVVVGYAHLSGLKDLLEKKSFESCRLDF